MLFYKIASLYSRETVFCPKHTIRQNSVALQQGNGILSETCYLTKQRRSIVGKQYFVQNMLFNKIASLYSRETVFCPEHAIRQNDIALQQGNSILSETHYSIKQRRSIVGKRCFVRNTLFDKIISLYSMETVFCLKHAIQQNSVALQQGNGILSETRY